MGKVSSRCIMMLALGRQCLFPFSPVRVIGIIIRSLAPEARYGDKTNQRREGENPWTLLGLHNRCVSVTKRTGRYVYVRDY
jgi:hypothetical protein